MRATHRKVPGSAAFYGLVESERRPVWLCQHSHSSRRQANACARRRLRDLGTARRRVLTSSRLQEVELPTDPEDGRPILSRSYVESFLQCVRYEDEHSPEAEWGNAVHDAIYAYWQLCVASREESRLGDVDQVVREAYFRPGSSADPNRYEEARDLVHGFVSSRTLELARLLVVARRPAIEFTLRADGGWCWLTGRTDRVDRSDGEDPDDAPRIIRIRDYKTGWMSSGGRRLDGAPSNGSTQVVPHEFQRRFYACLAFNDPRFPGLEAVETEIDFIRYHGDPEVITYERGELDGWWQDVRWALAQRWQARQGPPTGGAACTYCAARLTCGAATSEARAVPVDEGEAQRMVEEWIRTRARADSQRDALRTFLERREPMLVNGLEVGFLRPRRPTWRSKKGRELEIVTHLNQLGLAGDRVLFTSVDPRLVPELVKAPLVEAGVASWDPGAPTFKARKAGTEEE